MKSAVRKRNSAFTLVEMLVVMAIVGILAGVLTVALLKARKFSIRVDCQESLRQIGQAIVSRAMTNGGNVPLYRDEKGIPWWANVFEEWQDAGNLGQADGLPGAMASFHCRMGGALQNFNRNDAGTATGGSRTTLVDNSKNWTNGCWDRRRSPPLEGLSPLPPFWVRVTFSQPDGTKKTLKMGILNNTDKELTLYAPLNSPIANGMDYEIVDCEGVNNSISYGINFDVRQYPDPSSVDEEEKRGRRYRCVAEGSANYPDLLVGPSNTTDRQFDFYAVSEIAMGSEFILISEADTQAPEAEKAKWTGGRISMAAINRVGLEELDPRKRDDPPGNAPIVGRHDGLANVLLADQHVESMQADGQSYPTNINLNTPLWTLPDD